MLDDYTPEDEFAPELDIEAEEEWEDDEEISPEEVESVIAKLDGVLESVESETIHAILSEAYERIEELVDWEDADDEGETGATTRRRPGTHPPWR